MIESIVTCQFVTSKNRTTHFHRSIELIYVLEGTVQVSANNRETVLNTEDFLLINTNVPHEYQMEKGCLLAEISIDYVRLTELFQGEQVYFLCDSTREKNDNFEKMRMLFRRIFSLYQTKESQGILLRESAAYQLVYLLSANFLVKKETNEYVDVRRIADERVNDILNYLLIYYKQQITLQDLADHLFISYTYLTRYIKKNFGMSFLKLLNNIRLDYAVNEMQNTNKTMLAIAMDNGFPNQAAFTKVFKETYHTSPAEYRDELHNSIQKTDIVNSPVVDMERIDNYLQNNGIENESDDNAMTMVISGDVKQDSLLHRNWCKFVNVGMASDLLRYDVREQVEVILSKLHFQYARIMNLITDEILESYLQSSDTVNYSSIDKILDYLIDLGVHPYIELERQNRNIYASVNKLVLQSQNISILKKFKEHPEFLKSLIKHWVKRYGRDEVSKWYIGMERSTASGNMVPADEWGEIFQYVSQAFKERVPDIKIGGAGFSRDFQGEDIRKHLKEWKKSGAKPDFISVYVFPYLFEADLIQEGRNPYSTDKNHLYHAIEQMKQVAKEEKFDIPELIVEIWGFSLSSRNCLNDSPFKAAYTMENLIENLDHVDSIGYWIGTDVYSEAMDSDKILFGGSGMVSKNGIEKPVFHAYDFMNALANHVLVKNSNAIVSWNRKDAFFICCHNHKYLNYRYYLKNEDEITVEEQNKLFEDLEHLSMVYKIKGVKNGKYQVRTFLVNQEDGNPQKEWEQLGYVNDLPKWELEYLKTASRPKLKITNIDVTNEQLEVVTNLKANEIQLIIIEEM